MKRRPLFLILLILTIAFSSFNFNEVYASSTVTLRPSATGTYSQFVEVPTGFIFGDQFESNDFSLWTGTSFDSGGAVATISSPTHTGSYAANITVPSGSGKSARCYKTIVSSNLVFVREYVYVPTLASGICCIEAGSSSSNGYAVVGILYSSGTYYWHVAYSGDSWVSHLSNATVSASTWYCVELEYDNTNKIINLYVNGNPALGLTGLTTGGAITCVMVGGYWLVGGWKFYVDDVVVSTSKIGVENRSNLVNDQSDNTALQVTANVTQKETENLADSALTGTINSVTAYARVKASVITDTFVFIWRTEANDYETTVPFTLTTSYALYNETKTVNSNTGVAWTWTEVNALELGSRTPTNAATNIVSFSEYYIIVTYETSTAYTAALSTSWSMSQAIAVVMTWHSALTQNFTFSLSGAESWVAHSVESLGFISAFGTGLSWVAHTALTQDFTTSLTTAVQSVFHVATSNALIFANDVASTLNHIVADYYADLSIKIMASITSAQSWTASVDPSMIITNVISVSQNWATSINNALGIIITTLIQVILNGGTGGGGLTQAQVTAGYLMMFLIAVPAAIILLLMLRRR